MSVENFVMKIEYYSNQKNNMNNQEKDIFQNELNDIYQSINFNDISNEGLKLEIILAQQEINKILNQDLKIYRENLIIQKELENKEFEKNQIAIKEKDKSGLLDEIPGLVGLASKLMK